MADTQLAGIEYEPEEFLAQYRINDEDVQQIQKAGQTVVPKMDNLIANFYVWLEAQPEFEQFFSDRDLLERVKDLQRDYWKIFFDGALDRAYFDSRLHIGAVHARIGLGVHFYCAGMHESYRLIEEILEADNSKTSGRLMRSVTKLFHLDTATVSHAYFEMVNAQVAAQSNAIMEMSTPVTLLWEKILMLPLVGIIDSKRAEDVMSTMLNKIAETQSKVIILDISGVAVVDTAVANHLFNITRATKLMGCECIISGLSPAIAQTMVELGIEVGLVKTTSTLKDALRDAFHTVEARLD